MIEVRAPLSPHTPTGCGDCPLTLLGISLADEGGQAGGKDTSEERREKGSEPHGRGERAHIGGEYRASEEGGAVVGTEGGGEREEADGEAH